jgi:hypothetical protein
MFPSIVKVGLPAPPAMVPSKYGLISMTFFTVPLASYDDKQDDDLELTRRTDVRSSSRTRIYCYNDTTLEAECKCGSSVLDLDST